jgi:hypothetical protein
LTISFAKHGINISISHNPGHNLLISDVAAVSLTEFGGPITVKDYVTPNQATMSFDFIIKNIEPAESDIPGATDNFAAKCYMADDAETQIGTEVTATITPPGNKDASLPGNNAQVTLSGTVAFGVLPVADCAKTTKYCCRVYAPNPPNNYLELLTTNNKVCATVAITKNCKPGEGLF